MSSVFNHILELRDVAFSYTSDRFIEGLNVAIGEGEFVGLLGANGSGKSTILKLLGGIYRPDEGEINLWGKSISSYRNRDRAKLVSYLPQMLDMNIPFSVGQLAEMGLYPYEKMTGLGVDEALDMVGLVRMRNSLLTRLSGGERRRAYIAMTLLQGAGILLLDEPLANLDIRYQIEIIRLLRELNRKRNISIVMALHDVNLALRFEKLILIKHGRVLSGGAPEDVLSEKSLREAFDIDIKVIRNESNAFITYGDEENTSTIREEQE